jgi:hypothetical protein
VVALARVRAARAPVVALARERAVQAPEPAVVPGPVLVRGAPLVGLEPVEALERVPASVVPADPAQAVALPVARAREPAAVPALVRVVVRPRAVVLA